MTVEDCSRSVSSPMSTDTIGHKAALVGSPLRRYLCLMSPDPSAQPRVLVVEDDTELAQLTAAFLRRNGMDATVVGRGDSAVEWILRRHPDVVLLDLNLPGLSGFDVCRRVRPGWTGILVVLTARREEVDEVLSLELGADDYMAKPIRTRALLTRIQGHLRRRAAGAAGAGEHARHLESGDLSIDLGTRTVRQGGSELELSTAEFDLLGFMAQRPNTVVDRDTLYRELRGIPWDGLDRSMDLRMSRLRRRLSPDGLSAIKTVRGAGYLLVAP